MFFFYGTGNTRVTTLPLPTLACVHCGQPDSLSCTVFSRYVHLFWIPVFPIGKTSVTVCQHCKQTLTAREMPATYQVPVRAVQAQARTPLTNFALLLVLGVAIVFIFVVGRTSPRKSTATTAATSADTPAANDFRDEPVEVGARYRFSVEETQHSYGLAKVIKTTPDSVYYTMTGELRGELSDASATQALRDSLSPGAPVQKVSKFQWHYITTGQGLFKRFD